MKNLRLRRSWGLLFGCASLLAAPLAAEVVVRVPQDVATIQAAIDTVPDGGTIEIAAGTYVPPLSSGFLIQNEGRGFTMRAAPAATVTIDGQGSRALLRFQNTSLALGRPVVFEGLTFANGFSSANARAGGVTVQFAHATFRDCTFRGNVATPTQTGGGGVLAFDQVTLFFIDCLFEDNVAKNEGAGLKVDGTTASPSVAFVHRCRFFDNLANPTGHRDTAAGGAIHVGNAKLWVTNSRFVGNQAGYVGGAIFGIGTWAAPVTTPRAEVFIANSTFVGNQALANGVATPDAPEAGAVHAEDQTTMKIWNSRFDENSAGLAGAANSYRAILEIRDSVFRGNRATSTLGNSGFGGAIAAISNDTTIDGATNRRSATLLVSGSLLQGRYGATTTAAQVGGCLYASGDVVRRAGAGIPQVADATQTRAAVTIQDVVFDDCDVASLSTIPNGGGFELYHVNATISDSLVMRSDALGTGSGGGGGRINSESIAALSNVVFARNSAAEYGGALYLAGADVDLSGGAFLANEISPGTAETSSQSFGAALFVTGLDSFPTAGIRQNARGNVSGVVFAENIGLPIFDDDRDTAGSWYNEVTYDGATFHSSSFGDGGGGFYVFRNTLSGLRNTAGLNTLLVNRANHPDTDKSAVASSFSAVAPVALALRAVPPSRIAVTAAGDPIADTESFAGYAWSGGSATFDGSAVAGNAGRLAVGVGSHALQVSTQTANDDVAAGPLPAATLIASPDSISSGGTSTLTYATVAGSELVGALDQGLPAPTTADGVQLVSPVATTTYTFLGVTQQGSGEAEVTVLVDETLPLFADGFESSNTAGWSTTVP